MLFQLEYIQNYYVSMINQQVFIPDVYRFCGCSYAKIFLVNIHSNTTISYNLQYYFVATLTLFFIQLCNFGQNCILITALENTLPRLHCKTVTTIQRFGCWQVDTIFINGMLLHCFIVYSVTKGIQPTHLPPLSPKSASLEDLWTAYLNLE